MFCRAGLRVAAALLDSQMRRLALRDEPSRCRFNDGRFFARLWRQPPQNRAK
jgi:hypothetical protein